MAIELTRLSRLIDQASGGSAEAENQLASFFLSKAIAATHQKLAGKMSAEDQEDIALSAVKSFCLGLRDGRFEYRGDKQLFALLHTIIENKIRKLWQYHFAEKRDVRVLLTNEETLEEFPGAPDNAVPPDSIHVMPDEQPAVAKILSDLQSELHGMFVALINDLDEHPRRLLLTMLETDGTSEELAQIIGRSVASVERYRMLIRHKVERLVL